MMRNMTRAPAEAPIMISSWLSMGGLPAREEFSGGKMRKTFNESLSREQNWKDIKQQF